ncbi:superoxide dismutase family protein [Cellulophaga lytica]|uniref:Superoxide dismutase [Cu-Zn] n=1 Tax=Cellulophaga lytica (strain ATCC 23178 / DSM 7489 / JCM 8516 / NBRC 14961 / NCIMB 1423 / VKM B-1433 / Cy l20) TaxID=867900 RepID=F0RI63_CELLC|nr:superoxide dismutase family protein [Cellulophaga lytica]ADY30344.1 superoxide dismutase copper/zinc binding protein [Cellulophaga lytica DSM 7489]WQG78723.1 superoxide dismutase family protein [Cellulophaga lytica]
MNKIIVTLSILFISFTYSCKNQNKKTEETSTTKATVIPDNEKSKTLTITLEPKSNSNVTGKITFTQNNNKVAMVANLTGLKEGEHAIHIHEKADCSSDDGKSAGGHWNPTFEKHGKWGDKDGYHKGDIGNFIADNNGNSEIKFSTNEWCLGCEDPKKNILGKGIIVHEGVDDFTSQPSGNAGARVSCAGIIE